MRTDDLIHQLADELEAMPPNAASRRLRLFLALGAGLSLLAMLAILGVRTDIASASRTAPFWLKWIYTGALSVGAFMSLRRLANPAGRLGWVWLWVALPMGMVAVGATWELAHLPAALIPQDVFGHTAVRCVTSIALLAAPILTASVSAFRKFAPTRPGLAGLAAGFLSSTLAASVYAFACPETTMAFMAVWYSAGFAVTSLLGWAIGARALRW